MGKILGRFTPQVFALFRIVFGLLFSMHGISKLFGYPTGPTFPVGTFVWFGGLIELVCGLLILFGLFGNWAAFIASGEMAVAYFTAHQPGGFWPIVNKGEMAVLYCFAFLFIVAHGSGPWSLDAIRRKR